MALSKEFVDYVKEEDLRSVRICIKNCLLADHSLTNFKEYVAYAERELGRENLYQEHDCELFVADRAEWDKEYLAQQLAKVLRNFSRERLAHLQDIVWYLYRGEPRSNEPRRNNAYTAGQNNATSQQPYVTTVQKSTNQRKHDNKWSNPMTDGKDLKRYDEAEMPRFDALAAGFNKAVQVVDDVVLKNYATSLSKLDIVPLSDDSIRNDISDISKVRIFKVNEMAYEQDEFSSYKFASVFNSLIATKCTVFVIIDSDGISTSFYLGVRPRGDEFTAASLVKTLQSSLLGHFPGAKVPEYDVENPDPTEATVESLIRDIKDKGSNISSVSCLPNLREENQHSNAEFIQGLEKLVLAMKGQKYTGIIIANTTGQEQLREIRKQYESIYTQLSPFATKQVNYGQNSSLGRNQSTARGTSESHSEVETSSFSHADHSSNTTSDSHSISQRDTLSKVAGILSGAATVAIGAVNLPLGLLVGGATSLSLAAAGKTRSDSRTWSNTDGSSDARTRGTSSGVTESESVTKTTGMVDTAGVSQGITLTAHDKSIETILERIDKQLKRIDEFESAGMFECAAYFLASEHGVSEMVASTYKAIVGGVNTGVEVAAINTWRQYDKKTEAVAKYVTNFMHPVFEYNCSGNRLEVTPGSLVSGNELAIAMGLPRKSVCGLPVVEHADFGHEVVRYNGDQNPDRCASLGIKLGSIFNMGSTCANKVFLDEQSLAMHTFVTGSTGSGKSNTIYEMLSRVENRGIHFLVIEPAKGEYKHVFGNRKDVYVFGTNPAYTDLLKINPFKFERGVHVLEHVDRLVEIFNVCWPMYAAMPAVLKDAILKAYQDCGWDLTTSENVVDSNLFPNFADLQEKLGEVISKSAYSEEVKSNYIGSLVTRVASLTNGLNGQIFSPEEVGGRTLFDENVIIDLSRIGSLETKSLIMGILIMRLSEYRMATSQDINVPLKHVTVLEEAHNILKRTSTEQNPEVPNLAGKSVEMISNAIAEMRTYGEGFIIVDQSPNAIDISAIRNTNTKIIMRLPDEADRRLAGKAAGLKDKQLDEIAKLPQGVAVVYQNDWVEPVLCKIEKYQKGTGRFAYSPSVPNSAVTPRLKKRLLEFLLQNRVTNRIEAKIDSIKADLPVADLSTQTKMVIARLIDEYERTGDLLLWKEENFGKLAAVVGSVLHSDGWCRSLRNEVSEFSDLTDKILNEVQSQVPEVDFSHALAAAQCVMKRESQETNDGYEIYSAWVSELRSNKGVL